MVNIYSSQREQMYKGFSATFGDVLFVVLMAFQLFKVTCVCIFIVIGILLLIKINRVSLIVLEVCLMLPSKWLGSMDSTLG